MYFNITRRHTTDRYDGFHKRFIHSSIQVSMLIFDAENDPVSGPGAMRKPISIWKEEFRATDLQQFRKIGPCSAPLSS